MIDVGEDASFEDFVTFTLDQRLVDSLLWGNAVPLDPWKEEARMPASMLREALEADLRQADLERPSVSGRSVYSRSVIRVGTRLGIATVDVRYRPAPSAPTIETLNRTLGQDLPLDLPIDVAQILVGHPLQTPREIEDRLRFEGDRTGAFGLVRKDAIAFAVLHHNDLRQLRWLVAEALVHGPEERALARDLALGLGLYADHATLMSRETSPAALALADARARLDFGVNS
ncbi:MAG TPA: hypothetical protein ENK57_19740 [Polyangiaceae bacterium]|nr:hypothetical protein [Polyangiaceae bacterium]